jgi:hypothetical protein
MFLKSCFLLIFLFPSFFLTGTFGQVSINKDGSLPDSSAGLDVNFPDKGFLCRLAMDGVGILPELCRRRDSNNFI